LKHFYYKKGFEFDLDHKSSKIIEKFASDLIEIQGPDFLKKSAKTFFYINNQKVIFNDGSNPRLSFLGFEIYLNTDHDPLAKAILEVLMPDIDFSIIYDCMDSDILVQPDWDIFVKERLSNLDYYAKQYDSRLLNDKRLAKWSEKILNELRVKFDEKVRALETKKQDLKKQIES